MARLSLAVLGSASVTLDGQPVTGFTYHKARALLVYLAVEAHRAHSRDALVGLLWPDLPNAAARTNLRQALADLRQAIGDTGAAPPFLQISRDTIQLNPSSDYLLDAADFSALLATCATHAHRRQERCRSCLARMAEAIARYHGDFLTGFDVIDSAPFEEWQMRQREQLHQQALDALARLADHHERRDENEQARAYTQRQLTLDPWREEAHRQLMRLLARVGQRSAALAQYAACRHVLARDLGVAPAAETTRLYLEIRDEAAAGQRPRWAAPQHPIPPIPNAPTPLVGREQELAELGALLESPTCRLITVSGPGGIGKTRLALAVAAEQAETFADGAAFVPLAAISEATFITPAILTALGVASQRERDPLAQLLDVLCGKELLLVLDNLEQLLALVDGQGDQTTELLLEILQAAPKVALLVTSRERLQLPGEWFYDLAGLSYPADEPARDIQGYSAGQLFVQHARRTRRQFTLTDGEAQAVARICRLAEGMPLAIELAAAGLRGRSATAIADALEASVAALETSFRAIPARHRSIVAAFEHSWRLLGEEERQTFIRLSVFRGGFEEEAATQVALASPQILAALVDKSLLRWDGAVRYDLHELVRQYAGEKLGALDPAGDAKQRHARYFLGLAEAAEPELRSGRRGRWLDRLERELHNLRAAMAWSQSTTDAGEIALRFVGALLWFWIYRNHMLEGRSWAEAAVTASSMEPRAWASARYSAGMLAWLYDDHTVAQAHLMQSIQHWRKTDDQRGLAFALSIAGLNLRAQGHASGYDLCTESVAILRALPDPWSLAHGLYFFGNATLFWHGHAAARPIFEESLALWRTVDDPWGMALPLYRLGTIACAGGEYALALSFLEESLAIRRQIGHKHMIAFTLSALADVALCQDNGRQAILYLSEALGLYRELGLHVYVAATLERYAQVAARLQQLEAAVRLWSAAQALDDRRDVNGAFGEQLDKKPDLAAAHAQLDTATFTAAWAEGRSMTLDQAVAVALALVAALAAGDARAKPM